MDERYSVLYPKLNFTAEEMEMVRCGFKPTDMDHKWALYFFGDRLRMYRSWTGILIFDVGFAFDTKGGACVTDVIVDRSPNELGDINDDKALKLMGEIIRFHLLDQLDRPASDRASDGKQIVVRVGSEGGNVTLFGIRSAGGWRFKVETSEMELPDNEDSFDSPKHPWVATWRSALNQLDSYQWTQLFPVEVHLEFQDRVTRALQARQKKGLSIDWDQWGNALEILIWY